MLFVQLCSFLTDLNSLQSTMICVNMDEENRIFRRANRHISINLIFVMCGKLIEAWKLFDTRTNKEKFSRNKSERKPFSRNWFSRKYGSQLSVAGKKSLGDLKNYFKISGNRIKKIRNKIANHYDKKEIEKFLDSAGFEEIIVYVPKRQNWHFFSTAGDVFLFGFLDLIDPSSKEKAFKELSNEILEASTALRVLIIDYFKILADWYFHDALRENIVVKDPLPYSKNSINYFTKTDI